MSSRGKRKNVKFDDSDDEPNPKAHRIDSGESSPVIDDIEEWIKSVDPKKLPKVIVEPNLLSQSEEMTQNYESQSNANELNYKIFKKCGSDETYDSSDVSFNMSISQRNDVKLKVYKIQIDPKFVESSDTDIDSDDDVNVTDKRKKSVENVPLKRHKR